MRGFRFFLFAAAIAPTRPSVFAEEAFGLPDIDVERFALLGSSSSSAQYFVGGHPLRDVLQSTAQRAVRAAAGCPARRLVASGTPVS